MWPSEATEVDYSARRRQFLSRIKRGIAVFPAPPEVERNADVLHPFRQDSNFYYLTGFAETRSWLLLDGAGDHPFQIFVQPKDRRRELWHGRVLGPEAAKEALGADLAAPSEPESHFDEAFIAAIQHADTLWYRLGVHPAFDQRILRLMEEAIRRQRRSNRALWPIRDPGEILGEMRLVKSRSEIDRLQRAADITAEAHIGAMKVTKPGIYEYEVEAVLHHAFRVHGALRPGYGSIVASGTNACVLHYESNDQRLQERDLLLVDAGAEFDYYTADVTRTFPVGAAFTDAQREVYEAVLRAQKACIAFARPGRTMLQVHELAVEILVEELKRLKVLKGPSASLIKKKAYAEYYPHGTSHWLGMDVHDVGRYWDREYGVERKLRPGHVFTIEPGLYFRPDSEAPARYKGIGVRIEDDILITSNGGRVLTSAVPKEVEEIEALRSQV